MFTIYKYYILKNKIKNKQGSAHRIHAHEFLVGHHFNQVDENSDGIQDVGQKHVLVYSYPLAAEAPGRKSNSINQRPNAKVPGEKNILAIFVILPLAIVERTC